MGLTPNITNTATLSMNTTFFIPDAMCNFLVKVPLKKGDLGGSPRHCWNSRSPNPLKKGAKKLVAHCVTCQIFIPAKYGCKKRRDFLLKNAFLKSLSFQIPLYLSVEHNEVFDVNPVCHFAINLIVPLVLQNMATKCAQPSVTLSALATRTCLVIPSRWQ
jgi:hypothetical protein